RHGNVFDSTFQVRFAASLPKQIRDDFLSGESSKCQWSYELARRAGHHDFHRKTLLLQAARQFGRFVGRYAASDAKGDAHKTLAPLLLAALGSVLVFIHGLAGTEFVLHQAVVY